MRAARLAPPARLRARPLTLCAVLRDIHQRFGRLAYVRFITPSVTTTDPELVSLVMMKENFPKGPAYSAYVEMFGRGLVFINGATWNAHRRLMNTGCVCSRARTWRLTAGARQILAASASQLPAGVRAALDALCRPHRQGGRGAG